MVAAASVGLAGCTLTGDSDEADAREVLESFVELSASDGDDALGLTTLSGQAVTSCLDQSTWLRFAEVRDVIVDGAEAEATLVATTIEDPAPLTVQLHKNDGAWQIDLDDSMALNIAVSPAGAPASIHVGTCEAAVVDGVSIVALPPGEFDVVLRDPSGVLDTSFAEALTTSVELPGSESLTFELDDVPLSGASIGAINEAIRKTEESCASFDFAGLNCPEGAVGAISSEGSLGVSVGDQVDHEFVDGAWTFVTEPLTVRYGFEGEDDWTDVSVAYAGSLVSAGESGAITAGITDVTSPGE